MDRCKKYLMQTKESYLRRVAILICKMLLIKDTKEIIQLVHQAKILSQETKVLTFNKKHNKFQIFQRTLTKNRKVKVEVKIQG